MSNEAGSVENKSQQEIVTEIKDLFFKSSLTATEAFGILESVKLDLYLLIHVTATNKGDKK